MTAKQHAAAEKALQYSYYDDAARALEETIRSKSEQLYGRWVPVPNRWQANVYIFPREVTTSEASILYDQVPSRLYHHGSKYPIWKVPVEIMSIIFHQLPLFDRVNLARCCKRLAQIATENKILELEFKDRDELSDRKGFFADPSNFPLLWSQGTPEWSTDIYGSWWIQARTEIERQGGTYTKGIHHAINIWFVREMDPDDERIEWMGF
jgi:F-box domain